MSALLEKDFKEAIRNPSIILMPIVIIGLSYMWRVAFGKDIPENIVQMFQLMLINLTLVMISLSTLMNLFAEENDKGTLKGLIKTPASLIEIIISKIFIILIITLLSTIISLFIFNHPLYLRWSTYIGIILI
ncbi:ABC transporter permease, partial [Staphylococcus pettenkoferi]